MYHDYLFFKYFHKACIDECDDIAELLVSYGADIDAEDRELWTPLHASAACENFSMVQYLVENGANVAAINADGNLPVDLIEEDQELQNYLHEEMNKHGELFLPSANTTKNVTKLISQDILSTISGKSTWNSE